MNPIRKMRAKRAASKTKHSSTPIGDALALEMKMLDTIVMVDRQMPVLHRMGYTTIGADGYHVSCSECDYNDVADSAEGIVRLVATHSLEQVGRG